MARGRKPEKIRGIRYREDRNLWEASYKANGNRVRKSFSERNEAINWSDIARGLRLKEGPDVLPTSASEPLLNRAEKEARRQGEINSVSIGELCDDLKAFIVKHPTQYKDQVNPPRRLDRIKAALGEKQAASLKPREVEAWLDGLTNSHTQKGRGKLLSDASFNRYRVMLSAAYKRGIKNEKVTDNPVTGTSQRKLKNGVIRWLKPEEEKAIREAIQERIEWCEDEHRPQEANWEKHHFCEFIVSLQTGMRKGEQYGLTWTDVDMKSKQIHVKESKNGTERYIPMLSEVMLAFRTLKLIKLTRKDRREGEPNESPDDCCFALADPKKWWAAVLQEAKVRKYRWHDNRHSFCSRLVQAGKSLKVVQELAGH